MPSAENVYFGVHACTAIPPTNAKDEPCEPRHVRGQRRYIGELNCLYADFDAKDFADDKAAALAHVEALHPQPSALVDSGGGYHAYWLLTTPWLLTDDAQGERASALQGRWVHYVDGDKAAKDLARMLRVPGTVNTKYDPPRLVEQLYLHEERRYSVAELEALTPAPPAPEPRPLTPIARQEDATGPRNGRTNAQEVIARFNAEHLVGALLSRYGATRTTSGWACNCGVAHTHDTQLVVTDQGRIAFYSARCCWAPHRTDRNGRPIADAFDLFVQVEHHGDKTAALKAYNPIAGAHDAANVAIRRAKDAERKRSARKAEDAATRQAVRDRAAEDPILARRPSERAVLHAMLEVAGDRDWCRPSKPRLAKMAKCSLGAVKRALMELEARGYFTSEGDGGGPNDTALRTFLRGSPPANATDVSTGIRVIHESIRKERVSAPPPPAPASALAVAALDGSTSFDPGPLDENGWAALLVATAPPADET